MGRVPLELDGCGASAARHDTAFNNFQLRFSRFAATTGLLIICSITTFSFRQSFCFLPTFIRVYNMYHGTFNGDLSSYTTPLLTNNAKYINNNPKAVDTPVSYGEHLDDH